MVAGDEAFRQHFPFAIMRNKVEFLSVFTPLNHMQVFYMNFFEKYNFNLLGSFVHQQTSCQPFIYFTQDKGIFCVCQEFFCLYPFPIYTANYQLVL